MDLQLSGSAGAAQRRPAPEHLPEHWHDAMQAKYFTYVHMIVVLTMDGGKTPMVV